MATDPGLMAFQSAPDTGIMVTMPLFQAGYTADVRFVAESISLPFLNDATSDWAIMMPGD